MKYEDVLKIWAARQIGLPAESINSVYQFVRDVGGCDTCGSDIEIETSINTISGYRSIAWSTYDMGEMIQEMLDIARGGEAEAVPHEDAIAEQRAVWAGTHV